MNFLQYVATVKLTERTELEKVKLLAFFRNIKDGTITFNLEHILATLLEIGHPISNISRLKKISQNQKISKKSIKKTNTY